MSEVRKVDANKKINADLQDYNLDLPVLEKQSETEKIKSIFEKNKDKDSLNKTIYEGFEQTEAAIQRIKDENPLYALGDVTAATVNIANKPLEFVKGWTDEAIDSLRSDNEGINNVGVDGTGKVVKGATGMVTGAVETAGAIFSTEEGSFKRAAGKFADGAVDMGKGTANTVLGILGKGWIWGKTEETEDAPSSDDIAENQSESILAQLAEEANSNKASEEVKKVPETESESITEEPAVQAEEKTEEIQQQNAPKEEEPVAGEPDVETDFVHKEQAEAEEIVVSEEEPAIEEATEEVELTEEPVMAEEPVEEVQDAEEDFFSDELEIDDYLMTSDKVDAFLNNVLKDSVDYKTAVSEVLEKKNDGLIDNEAASKILLAKMYRASISVDDALDTLEKMDDGMGLGIWEKMLIAGKEPGNIDTMPEEYAGIKDCSENDFISGFKSVFSLGKQDSPISEELLPDEEPQATEEAAAVEETVLSEEQVAEEPVMTEEAVIPEEESVTVEETAADEEQTVADMAAVNKNVIEQELLIENNDDLSEDDGADLGAKYVSLVEDLAKYYAHIAEDAPDVELIDAKSIEELKLDMANHYSSLEFNEIDPETDAQLAAYRNLIGFISEHGKPELDEPIVNSVKIEDAEEARKAEEARLADVTEQVPVTEDKENKLKSILDGFYNALSMSVSFPFGLKNSDESQSAEAEQPAEEPEIVLNNAETPETQAERELVLEEEPAPEEEYAIEDSNDAQNMHVSQPAPLQKIPEAVERSIETREKLQASLGNAYEPFSVSTEAEYVSENIAETEEAPAQNPEPQAEPVPVEEPAISEENAQTEETEAEEPVQNEETVQNEEPVITDDHKESLPGIDIVEEALADVAKMEEDDAEQPAQKEVQISDIISIPAEELGEYEIAAEAEPASQEDLAIAEEQVTVADESAQSEEQVVTEEPAQIEEFVINEKKPESMPGISDVDDALAILAEMEESDVQNTAPQAEQTFTEEPSITEENVQPEEIVAADKPIQAEEIRVVENETSQTGHLAGSEDVADAIAALDEMETENAEQLVQPEEQDVADEPAPAEETPVIEEHVSEAEAAPAEEPVAADGQVQPEEQVVAEETVPAEETVIEEEQPDESVNTTGFEEFNDMIESLGLAAKPESVSDNAQTGLSEKTAALINASQKDSADFETAVPDILKSVELNEINDDDAVQMIFFKMLRADRDNIDLMIYAYEDDLSDKQKAVINKVYNLYDAADKKAYGEEIRALSEEAYIKAVTSKMTPVAADTEEKAPEVALVSEQEYAEPAAEEQIPAAPADDISAVSETPVSSKSDTVKRDAGLSDIEEALALADELDAEPAEKTEEKQVKNAEPAPEEEAEAAPEPLPAEQTPAVQAQVSVKIPVVLDKNALALAGELMKDSADFKDAANTIMDKAETGEISTDSAIELLANKMYREKCDYLRVLIFVGEKGFTPTGEAIIAELEKRTYRADFEEITKNLSSASETDFLKHVEASLYTVGPDEPGPTTEIVSNTLNVDNTQIAAEKSESAPAADEAQVLEPKDTAIAKNMPQTESVEKTEPEETFVQVENQVQPVETIIAKMEQPKVIADENALALVDELMRDSADFDNAVNTIMDKAIAGEITTDSAITLIESKMSRTKSDYLATMISLGPKWYDTSIGISVKDEVKKFCENEDYSVREDFVKMTQNYSSMSETDFLNTVKGENTTVLADNNTESVNTEEEPQLVQNAVSNQQPSFEPEKHVTEEKQIVKTDIQPQYEQPDTEKVSQPEIASVQQALNPEENFENELDNLFVMFKKGEFEEDALTNQVAQAIFDSGMQFDDAIGIVIDKKNEAGLFDSSLVYDLVTKYNFL